MIDIFQPDFQKKGCAVGLIACAALLGILIGYGVSRSGGVSASGIIVSDRIKNTSTPTEKILATATLFSTLTPAPTKTTLPTYTPRPTFTKNPTHTPSPTNTQTYTPTATQTRPPAPTRTRTPTKVPPNEPPPPTATVPAPVTIESCNVDPSTVPIGINVDVTYYIQFSTRASGYGFEAKVDAVYPEQSGCGGVDDDGDGLAYCVGSSGIISEPTTVYVTLSSSVGECVVSYSSR